jgi:protein TonB
VVRTDEADTPVNDAIATVARNRAPVESDRLASSESYNPEETETSGSGSASGPDGAGGPGYGTGGNGSGGSFVDAVGDATTAPFISWVDRSIRKRLYYPEKARLRNLEGTVTLGMAVPADGSRCEVVLAKSSGHEVLDHAAIGLVRSLFPAKVAPGRDFSAPVRIRYTLVDN